MHSTPRPGWCASTCYRAIGQQHKFEGLALEYAQQFGWSAPQWYSLPKLVAEAASNDERPSRSRIDGQVGWVCPETLDTDGVARLSSQTLQMPLPWVFDWSALKNIDAEACAHLSELFRYWIPQQLDMRWLGRRQVARAAARRRADRRARRRPGVLATCAWTHCAWRTGRISSTRPRSTTA